MQRVIVTVKRKDEARVRDLEVPADVEAEQLAEMIARALHWEKDAAGRPVRYRIEAHPLGRILQPHESLAAAEVWDGSWLVFLPEGTYVPPAAPAAAAHLAPAHERTQEAAGPVVGWRPLGLDLPDASAPAPAPAEKPSPGYVWKQID